MPNAAALVDWRLTITFYRQVGKADVCERGRRGVTGLQVTCVSTMDYMQREFKTVDLT